MANVTIFGKGNMGTAIASVFERAGNTVNFSTTEEPATSFGDIIVLAVPYPALEGIAAANQENFAGKIVIDITNPVNFQTFDELIVPADSSAAAQLQAAMPGAKVVKGFNTTLTSGKVAGSQPTTVLLASEHADAKEAIMEALKGGDVQAIDAGSLKRARELEAMGFLQISLAAQEKIAWTGGFGIFK
ncbi:NADPH-dependent F420 reductase [Streptococcus sobrinus]|uniref:NADPH-dependent F420 reductase n=1 Tax=Streptococcus sobrinus TaxID=1310 RepID=UPI0003174D68|nr:NAD(P)-binding domain-containing protein [Streptococcus sobrinus]